MKKRHDPPRRGTRAARAMSDNDARLSIRDANSIYFSPFLSLVALTSRTL